MKKKTLHKSTKDVKLDDDDEEEESEGDDDSEGESGPDPEIAKVRFAELEAAWNEQKQLSKNMVVIAKKQRSA
jgi:RNA polymerase primary sigma factor